ncbi:MAG TPA: T9SS type A sorting domain-containing protein, partial [Flavitalea sp.]|nr:T9SS type A sorting domain-containing protein [Flavitalea sp.]
LTKLKISTLINNDSAQVYEWTGSLDYLGSTTINLRKILLPGEGKYSLRFIASQPNDSTDEGPANDSLSISTQYYASVEQLSESFESTLLPPGWDIIKKTSLSWQRINGIAADGNASYLTPNFGATAGRTDLRLRTIRVDNVDSAYLGFKIAATRNGSSAARADEGDTLQVLLSTDCDLNNTVLYSKSGNSLSTTGYTSDNEYTPSASEWKADSINLTDYVGKGDLLISFRNGGAGQNNVYLDDIELRTITVNPNLKARGILISPNPARNSIAIQFYPPPTDLRSISLFTMSGQKLKEISVSNTGLGLYNMDLSGNPAGIYLVVLRYADRIVQRKIVKVN